MKRKEFISGMAAFTSIALLSPRMSYSKIIKPKLHFIGIGTGMKQVKNLLRLQYPNAEFTNVSSQYFEVSDERKIFFQSTADLHIFQEDNFNGKVKIPEKLLKRINVNQKLIIYSGLGGTNSSYLVNSLLEYCEQRQLNYKLFAHYPFRFEGKKRMNRAHILSRPFSKNSSFHCFHLEEKRKYWGNTKLSDAFELADQTLFNLIKSKA
jgi:cell division GTPase FtsZ